MKVFRFSLLLLTLLLAVVLIVPAAAAENTEFVRVSNAEELLEAIAPGANIELEPGLYNISTALSAKPGDFTEDRPWMHFEDCWDGLELVLVNLDGLTLRGLGEVEIVAEPRMADVIRFVDCSNLTLSGLTLGHTIEPGMCTGEVLEFVSCSGIVLDKLDLYGCGTYGINASDCADLRMEGSVIRECSYGILCTSGCRGFRFLDCEMRDCGGYYLLPISDSSLSFDGCRFENNSGVSGFLSQTAGNSLRFYNCSFGPWESVQLASLREETGELSFDSLCSFADGEKGGSVTVSSVEEFLDAIRPGAVIGIQPGTYDLSAWASEVWETEGESWNSHHPFVRIRECYDGVEICINGADGLSILGLGRDRGETELIVTPRYANVLCFENCGGIGLANLTLGHTEGGTCSGSVLYLDNVTDITLTNLDLYGCGTNGVFSSQSGRISMRGCTVRDCSEGPLQCYGSWDYGVFEDCVFVDSDGGFSFYECPGAQFTRCVFGPKEYSSLAYRPEILLENCWH